MDSTSDHRQRDYLFDLQGYLVLKVALAERDLDGMNRWLDDHWSYVQDPPSRAGARGQLQEGRWIGHVELHSYGPDDGVNFQNIVEGGAVFERLIESASPPSGARSWNRLRPAVPTCRRHHLRYGRRASTGAGVGSPTIIREKSACS